MEIINDDVDRGVTDMDDVFLRFISKEGISSFPTVMALANRFFLTDEEMTPRAGKHKGITLDYTIKVPDDFRWYKIKGAAAFKPKILAIIDDICAGISYFEPDESNTGIKDFWYSGKMYYINYNGELKVSKAGPTDLSGNTITLPSQIAGSPEGGDDVLDVLTLDATRDVILTKKQLYVYEPANNACTQRFKVSNNSHDFTSICLAGAYLVLTSTSKIYIIKNWTTPNQAFTADTVGYNSWTITTPPVAEGGEATIENLDNGLPSDDKYTYCVPTSGNKFETNGSGGSGVVVDYDAYKSSQQTVFPNGRLTGGKSSRNYNSVAVAFGSSSAISQSAEYRIGNGISHYRDGRYEIIVTTGGAAFFPLSGSVMAGDPPEPRSFFIPTAGGVPSDASAIYAAKPSEAKIFAKSGLGAHARSGDSMQAIMCPTSFVWNTDKDLEELDVEKMPFTLSRAITFYYDLPPDPNDGTTTSWATVNGKPTTFLFVMARGPNGGKARWYAFGDDDRRDTTMQNISKAFDIG